MPLRTSPPSSEKASHRMHMRNDAKYTPVKSPCVEVTMISVLLREAISCAALALDLTLIFILILGEPVLSDGEK